LKKMSSDRDDIENKWVRFKFDSEFSQETKETFLKLCRTGNVEITDHSLL